MVVELTGPGQQPGHRCRHLGEVGHAPAAPVVALRVQEPQHRDVDPVHHPGGVDQRAGLLPEGELDVHRR
jgi:hypothetical protein